MQAISEGLGAQRPHLSQGIAVGLAWSTVRLVLPMAQTKHELGPTRKRENTRSTGSAILLERMGYETSTLRPGAIERGATCAEICTRML